MRLLLLDELPKAWRSRAGFVLDWASH